MDHFLERIELQGFKSFAPKTVFEFPSRVTAIVGPNGSGKSNVIDALRWVLGERVASELRGGALENLIFAGTPKRSAAGFARVSLVFKNHPRLFPVDAPEVVIERKTDRSGASSFYMNSDEVRLKDLIPMLARARLGSRGLTMVGQGQGDLFVRSTPRERRAMIEEILGLREYRLKKEQAERQLAASLVNMERVQAMLEELAPHVRFLRKQKSRFERRSEIEGTLKALEDVYFGARFHTLARASAEAEVPHAKFAAERKAKEEEIRILEDKRRSFTADSLSEAARQALREKKRTVGERRRALERDLARFEVEEELLAKQEARSEKSAAELGVLLSRAAEDAKRMLALEDLPAIRKALKEMIVRIEETLENKEKKDLPRSARLTPLREELAALENDFVTLEADEERFIEAERTATETFRAQVEILEMKKNELRALERALEEKAFARERFSLQMEELQHAWAATGRDGGELVKLPAPKEAPGEDAERKTLRLRGELAAIGEIDQALVKEADEAETRYAFLSREHEDVTKATRDLEKLIRDLDQKIHNDFKKAFREVNDSFHTYFRLMFGGGKAYLKLTKPPAPKKEEEEGAPMGGEREAVLEESQEDPELSAGVEIELSLPKKKITSLEMLSGGEKSLVSLAALFALIAVSPPPFLVLDEIDAPLDEVNAARFAELVKEFAKKTQFIIVTHNRATMEAADALYGITMEDDGISKVLSLKLER
ncbi:MAG: AAA family ATPase [Candidatus Brennerbacteria bacterium]|nr:AAA family ATPase [Candidatus Brennerbacteria bacterium]